MKEKIFCEKKNRGYKILAQGLFNDVKVVYNPQTWNAHFSSKELLEIDQIWESTILSAKKAGKNLYNSEILRLGKIECFNDSMSLPNLHLYLGVTDYKQYVATRDGEFSCFADPIGTAVILTTIDGYIPIGRRSLTAEVNSGKFFTFGGFFDKNLDHKMGQPDIYSCVKREVLEELNIEISESQIECLGIVYDTVHPHPELSFLVKTDMTRKEIEMGRWQEELSDLTLISIRDIMQFVNDNSLSFTESLLGGFELFSKLILQRDVS